jgi:hypothetical protein
MFWQPDYREASPWLEHLPFLFWLVEALRPQQAVGLGVESVAHFAVCQSASRLRLGTRCFMVGVHEEDAASKQDAEASSRSIHRNACARIAVSSDSLLGKYRYGVE